MKVESKELEPLVRSVDITIEKSDYQTKFEAELKKLKQKAQLKGFRQGKTPMSVIKKYYGESLMAQTVSEVLEKELAEALKAEKINQITQPKMADDSPVHNFNPNQLEDYLFSFEIPVFPEFEVGGIGPDASVIDYKIEVDQKLVDEEFDAVRKRLGQEVKIEKDIQEEDRLTIHCKETNGKGGIKRGGWETGFSVLYNMLSDEYKTALLGKDVGEEFEFDIYQLEKDKSDKYVKKYLLNLDDEEEKEIGNIFKGEIKEITRIELAEVNQDFLDKYMGKDVVSSEEEAKAKIKENIAEYYKGQSNAFLHRTILEHLVEVNPMELPDDYLKKFLKDTNETLSEEIIEKEYKAFAENIKWDAIKGKLFEQYEIKVEMDDVKAKMRDKVASYLGGQAMGMDLEPFVNNLMGDQKELTKTYEEVASEKMLSKVAEEITLQEETISIEKFGELVKEMNEKLKN